MPFVRKEFHKEENCLNCNYPLVGKYCGNCGQKAFLHKDSFWHMITHFAGDYFHYDNKFWITLKTLFTKPGLTTIEYNAGKRAKYLNPIQLYIFVTTIFFIFGMSAKKGHDSKSPITIKYNNELDSLKKLPPKGLVGYSTNSGNGQLGIGPWTPNESTIEAYDSVQNSLPEKEKDAFWLKHLRHKSYEHTENLGEQFKHNFPKIFFILLPFFAMLLAFLFRKKKMYYVDHIIFSIHFHSFVFILFIIDAILLKVLAQLHVDYLIYLLTFIGIGFYLFRALKNVYPSHGFKLFIKQFLLFFLYFWGFLFSMIALYIVLFLFF